MADRKECIVSGSHQYTYSIPLTAAGVQVGDCIAMRGAYTSLSGRVVTIMTQFQAGVYRFDIRDAHGVLHSIYSGEACVLGRPEIQF